MSLKLGETLWEYSGLSVCMGVTTVLTGQVLVTGGTGFVGGALLRQLAARGTPATAAVRASNRGMPASASVVQMCNLTSETDWRGALKEVSVVVHLAGRVHVMQETATDSLAAFREVNVLGTCNLARQAAASGVRRFVFVSSIKVNGEQTEPGRVFSADDAASPKDPYGLSKWEAEQRLMELAEDSGMEVVVIRPPIVYGPGVKANFLSMMRWLSRGIPLPLGAIHYRWMVEYGLFGYYLFFILLYGSLFILGKIRFRNKTPLMIFLIYQASMAGIFATKFFISHTLFVLMVFLTFNVLSGIRLSPEKDPLEPPPGSP